MLGTIPELFVSELAGAKWMAWEEAREMDLAYAHVGHVIADG